MTDEQNTFQWTLLTHLVMKNLHTYNQDYGFLECNANKDYGFLECNANQDYGFLECNAM
jgi:hypothetical protein